MQIDKVLTFDDPNTPSSAWDASVLLQDETVDVVPAVTANHAAPPVEVKSLPSSPNGVRGRAVGSNGIDLAARKRRRKSAKFKCFVLGCKSLFTTNHNLTCEYENGLTCIL